MYEKVREELKRQDMTINKLAKKSNIASQDLYSAFKGTKPFYPNWKKRVCEALGKNENELFWGAEHEN